MKNYRKLNIKPSEAEKAARRKKEAEEVAKIQAALRPGSDINAAVTAPLVPAEESDTESGSGTVSTETQEEDKA